MIFESCHVVRYVFWNTADITDHKKFPSVGISAPPDKYVIPHSLEPVVPDLPSAFNEEGKFQTFNEFLEENKTVSFLIIKDGKIVFENYFDGYTSESVLPSFSISKSIISALLGIAIDEGCIKSVHQPITDFLPELDSSTYGKITIEHLLNMRSGLKFNEGYFNPFGDVAKFYYGKNVEKYTFKTKIKDPPDQYYEYISVNTQFLTYILERATGTKCNVCLQDKIWKKAGMEYDASWNVDSKKYQSIKGFCCINASIYDYAKFGMIYLNNGELNGVRIISEDWIDQSIRKTNGSLDSQNYPYHYGWRVKKDGAYFAKGILGQYIYVDPGKNVIILRFGKKEKKIIWAELFEQICSQY
jgi:CubicO group peptidase (beta-lactamase class C family)